MYSIVEIFQFAINIEENGKKFYTKCVEKFKDDEIKQLFMFLAEEEERHKNFFQDALSKIKEKNLDANLTDEYFQYIKYFVDTIVFNKEIEEKVNMIDKLLDALEFAKIREMESIHYYLELRLLVDQKDIKYIDKIIEEEREHFLKLEYFKQKYSKQG